MKTIYIGFAIDMDGVTINNTNKDNVIVEGLNKLFNFFDNYNCKKQATWYINELSFKKYPEIINKCIKFGELGLHIPCKKEQINDELISDWIENNLQRPTSNLQNILNEYNKKLISCKLGNNLHNDKIFNAVGELQYIYDTNMIYEDIIGVSNVEYGSFPFLIITTNNYRLLEIPEIFPVLSKVKKHIDNSSEDQPIFIRLKINIFDIINNLNFLSDIDKIIEYCKTVGNVNFKNIEQMGDLFIDYELKKMSDKMLNEYRIFSENDLYYIDRLNKKYNSWWQESEIYIIKYIFKNFNNINIKIVDCFAAWGQIAIILNKLGYKNLYVVEYCDYIYKGKEIALKEKCNDITFLYDDFYKCKEIRKATLFISVNSVNECLNNDYDKQNEIYQEIYNNNGNILIDVSRYGIKNNGYNFYLNIIKKNFNNRRIDKNFIHLTKKMKYISTKKISLFFDIKCEISTYNVSINEINDNNDLLSINLIFLKNEINSSAGIFFSFTISFLAKYNYYLPIQKYRFSFNAKITKIDSDFRFKIYTGIKYFTLEKELTEEYQEFVLEEEFNFNKSSTYRIGFVNPKKDIELFINNPLIEII